MRRRAASRRNPPPRYRAGARFGEALRPRQFLRYWRIGGPRQRTRRGNGGWRQGGIGQRGQLDPRRCIANVVCTILSDGKRSSRRAHATRTDERQEGNRRLEEQRQRRGV